MKKKIVILTVLILTANFAFAEIVSQNTQNGCNFVDTSAHLTAIFEPNSHDCSSGYYLPANIDACSQCPANSYCGGGTYNFNETTDQGIQSCNGGFSPAGSSSINSCYPHIMHVGNDVVYLKSTSRTIPSLNVQIGNEIFYANMETTQTYMSSDSPHYFRIQSGNNNYWVCDDTTCPEPEVVKK